MKEYRCKKCCFYFCSENGFPYCPACDCNDLEYIYPEIIEEGIMESHHIHPRFMDNKKGEGQQFLLEKKEHNILHGLIMKWLWEEVECKEKAIKNIIRKSKIFIKVK